MSTSTVTTTTAEELIARARSLTPKLKERAARAEADAKVPDTTIEELTDAGLVRIGTPVRFGGTDVEWETVPRAAIELARGCASTAWIYALYALHNHWLGFWPLEAQEEIWANGPDMRASSAQLSIRAHYERVDGGYRVSGHGQFASGVDHAQWLFAIAMGPEGPLQVLVPREEFRVLDGTWEVTGLKGTGSKQVIVDDTFVPGYRARHARPPGDVTGDPEPLPHSLHPQRRYKVGALAIQGWDLTSVAVGSAQGAIDEVVDRMTGTSGHARSGSSEILHHWLASASASVDAAMALMHADFEDALGKGDRGEPITPLDLTRYLRNRAFGVELAVNAATKMFDIGGARSLALSDPLQRHFRDVQAAAHGPAAQIAFAGQPYARLLLGLDPTAVRL